MHHPRAWDPSRVLCQRRLNPGMEGRESWKGGTVEGSFSTCAGPGSFSRKPPPTPAKAFPPLPAKPATSGGWAGGAGGAYAAAQVNASVVQSMSGESLDAVTFCEFYAFLARKALHVLQGSTSHCTAQSALGLRNNNDDVPISCYIMSVTSIKRRLRYPECMYAQHLLRLECCPLLFLSWAVRPPPIPFAHPYGFSDIFFTLQYYYCVVVVFFTLTDRASTIPNNTRGCQSGTWSAGQKKIRGTSTKLQ